MKKEPMENYLIEHCSPTLASLKTANLFNYTYTSEKELTEYIRTLNRQLYGKGVSVAVLRRTERTALIYVYRKKKLAEDLQKPGVTDFLSENGYTEFSCEHAIHRLRMRFAQQEAFPHEIGLFLGYPLGDVLGFIENAGKNSKCSGCWKVYCNECEAMKIFAKFDKCKTVYKRLFHQGRTLTQLTVAA